MAMYGLRGWVDAERVGDDYRLTAPDGSTGLVDAAVFEAMWAEVDPAAVERLRGEPDAEDDDDAGNPAGGA